MANCGLRQIELTDWMTCVVKHFIYTPKCNGWCLVQLSTLTAVTKYECEQSWGKILNSKLTIVTRHVGGRPSERELHYYLKALEFFINGQIQTMHFLEVHLVSETRESGIKYTGALCDFAPEMQKRALKNKKRAPENCHRLQCKSLFNVADLYSEWDVKSSPRKYKFNFWPAENVCYEHEIESPSVHHIVEKRDNIGVLFSIL